MWDCRGIDKTERLEKLIATRILTNYDLLYLIEFVSVEIESYRNDNQRPRAF